MRSSAPIPSNPWPHDMLLTIEDHPKSLIDLLWVREAYELQPTGTDLPPLLSDNSVRANEAHSSAERGGDWESAWAAVWDACLEHAGQGTNEEIFTQLHRTADGSEERAALLRKLMGPDWRDTFGDDAFNQQYRSWCNTDFEARSKSHSRPLDEGPERVSLMALIPAWEAGLTKIVTIPCIGTYTRTIGQHALLVTAETREEPERYAEALSQFR